MEASLSTALDRLTGVPPSVAPFAVRAVFAALGKAGKSGRSQRDAATAVRKSLDSEDKDVVEEAVDGLLGLVKNGGFGTEDALDSLLSALYAAAPSCCAALITGIGAISQAHCSAANKTKAFGWGEHPLTKAARSRVDAAPETLSTAIQLMLRSVSAQSEGASTSSQMVPAHLAPYFSHVLLHPSAVGAEVAGEQAATALAASCHSQLVRIACGAAVELQVPILSLLVSHLPLYRVSDPATRAWLLPAVADVIDALACVEDAATAGDLAASMAAALLGMGYDLAAAGLPVSPVVSALGRLAELTEELSEEYEYDLASVVPKLLLKPHASLLGLLSLRASGNDRARALALVSWALSSQQASDTSSSTTVDAVTAGMLIVPVLHAVAMQPNASAAQLGAAVLVQLRHPRPVTVTSLSSKGCDPAPSSVEVIGLQREVAALALAEARLRHALESGSSESSLVWLQALKCKLEAIVASRSEDEHGAAAGRWSPLLLKANALSGPAKLSLPVLALLSAHLGHPSPQVRCAAAEAAVAAASAAPLSGPELLPVLLFQLQQSVEALCAGRCDGEGGERAAAASCHSLLLTLARLGSSPATVRAVLGAIQPLAHEKNSERLRCLAMRLLSTLWQSSGRAWPPLRALLLPSSEGEGALLRLARAACVRDVCEANGQRGVELVKAIEEALRDAHPGVAALGMRSIGALCESDDLDFYAAWRVIVKLHPRLPAHPLLAAKWVALLGCGALDAQLYPDAATAVIELLWGAASHPSHAVRREAYTALAAYPIQLLQELEMEVRLRDYALPVLTEEEPAASAAAQELVGRALAHESSRRRRGGGGGGGGAAAPPGSLYHRMTRTLPRQLCSSSSSAATRAPRPAPGALLLCYLPPAPPGVSQPQQKGSGGGKAAAAAAARGLADEYERTFREVASTGLMGGGPGEWEARHQHLVAAAWKPFLSRWLKAAAAALVAEAAKAGGDRPAAVLLSSRAAQEVWGALRAEWEGGEPFSADSAAMATGSLCACLGPAHPAIVSDGLARLSHQLRTNRSPTSQRVAASALGVATAGLHPTEWQSWSDVSLQLRQALRSGDSAIVRASAAEALGGMVGLLSGGDLPLPGEPPSERSVRESRGAAEVFGALLSALASFSAAAGAVPTVHSLLRAAPSDWAPHMQLRNDVADALPDELLTEEGDSGGAPPTTAEGVSGGGAIGVGVALWKSLGLGMPALLRRSDGSEALCALFRGALDCAGLADGAADGATERTGPLLLLAMLAEPLLKAELVEEEALHCAVDRLQALVARPANCSAAASVKGAAVEALGCVAAALVDCGAQLRDEDGVAYALAAALSQPSASIQASAALGCAALLGAPVTGSDIVSGRRARQHLLASVQEAAHTKAVLAALEEAALKGIDPRGQRVASWLLATLCAALRVDLRLGVGSHDDESGRQPSASGDADAATQPHDSALLPLYTLPAEGALRELVTFLGAALTASSPTSMASTAAVLRCLSQVERLPGMNWGALCRRLMRAAALVDAERRPAMQETARQRNLKCQVRAACASLALKHGHRSSLGLGELLDELLEGSRFVALEGRLQCELLEGLPALLSSLSPDRAMVVVARLPALVASSGTQVRCSAWKGLAALLAVKSYSSHAAAHPSAAVSHDAAAAPSPASARVMPRPLFDCLAALLSCLPPPPPWHGGMWAGVRDPTGAAALWSSALGCLCEVSGATLLQLLAVEQVGGVGGGEAALRAVFARASLAATGKLQHRELQVCKTFCIDAPWKFAESAAMAVAHAYVSAPQAAQDQCLRDTLNTVKICGRPLQAFTLTACMVAAWAAAVGLPDESMVTAVSSDEALDALPATLPALLSARLWRPSVGVVTEQLLSVLQTRSRQLDDSFHARVDKLIWPCLVSLRSDIPPECWSSVADHLLTKGNPRHSAPALPASA